MASSSRMKNPKHNTISSDQRKKRRTQIIFNALAVILIISWILSLLINV